MKQIGFSHGVMHKIYDVYSKESIDLLKNCGCNAIEINCHLIADADRLNKILPFIQNFDRVSLHLPCDIKYKNNKQTNDLLKIIYDFYIKADAKLAVVHPDLVEDWSVFDKYTSMNWAIENMDDRKGSFKGADDLREFFKKRQNWKLVLDLGHCKTNDKTMALARDLIKEFEDRIAEIHLSGYKNFHEPLFKTEQVEIIECCNSLNSPIIIESTFERSDDADVIVKEFKYILERIC